jgi:site-specific recombinase XerD
MPDLAPLHIHPSPAWADAWEGYELAMELQGRSKSTISSRKSNVLAMARYFTARQTDPAGVTKLALSRYLVDQSKDRQGCGPQALHKDLRQFWRWMAEEEEIPDPSAKITRPSGKSRPVQTIAWADMQKIMAACVSEKTGKQGEAETARNRAVLWLLLESGLRRFEVAALKLSDIDRAARHVQVRKGKGSKSRTAVYGLGTADALRRWLKHRGREDGPLFTTFMGCAITPSGLSQLVKRVSERSGVEVRPHMFRHTWADAMLAGGIREHDLMSLAGWSSGEMLKVYGAVRAEQRALEAARSIQVGQVMRGRR